jgi:hypothetical protein
MRSCFARAGTQRSRRSKYVLLAVACTLGTAGLPALTAHAQVTAGSPAFGPAQQVRTPRNAAGGDDALDAVACPSTGDCVAGGSYDTEHGKIEPMTVTQFEGRWHRAGELRLPHDAAYDPGAAVTGVACAQAGSCDAVGSYLASDSHPASGSNSEIGFDNHGFIATESDGRWSRARTVQPPRNAYRSGYGVTLTGVSCPRPGWCEAIGNYTDKSGRHEALAVTQVRGRWHRAVELVMPVHAAANPGASLTGISCRRAGSCAAVGQYLTRADTYASAGLVERTGRWGRATQLRPPRNSASSYSSVNQVACAAGGYCLSVGVYELQGGGVSALAVTEAAGRWARATEINASPAGGTDAGLNGIGCAAAAMCYGAGGFDDAAGGLLAFALTWSRGGWSDPQVVSLPANAATGSQAAALLNAVGCSSAGYCAAVGFYDQITTGQSLAMVTDRP